MAIIHRAELTPGKLELLEQWLPRQSWYAGSAPLERLGAYRFDDPAGEVGVEVLLVSGGGRWQVPLTYRAAPLDGADEHLVGTTQHSVLGHRWVYDGCADPVAVALLADAVRTGAGEAQEYVETDGELVPRAASASVRGSGGAGSELVVRRHLDGGWDVPAGAPVLTGTWEGQAEPLVLAALLP
ncbi:hypothetical protein EV189_2747 [Motilibacter rhizosphaerae]|uniref:Maltokinase N-terminal cap domain-containing protein n=1 Tax=Motilibacter rhizosphaerae TaxID=598652 RepID=A0A4Q7NQC0_9ACTN|nr:hypothetical protein [Motilibacter rhizosphaerae]RZS87322.1 hypothetical protein EV189_2747 [Motilibacter rhizosphaerae]